LSNLFKSLPLNKNNHGPWQAISLAIASLVFFPVITLLILSIIGDSASELNSDSGTWSHLLETVLSDYIVGSLQLMLGVAALTLLLGIGSAWLVTQYQFTGVRFFHWALLLPLAMPTYITAYSYTGLLDVAGPIQSGIRSYFEIGFQDYWFPEIRSMGGAIFVMAFVLYPYVYLLARASFVDQSQHLRDAAQLLGYSRRRAFFKISLPIARPAIIAGLSLALMETLADYGAVSYFGVSTFTTGIFRTWYGLDSVQGAAQLSIVLLMFIIVLLSLEKHSRKRSNYGDKNRNNSTSPKPLSGVKNVIAFFLASTPLLLGFLIPITQLFIWSIVKYEQLFESSFWSLVINTLTLAGITALAALLLALVAAYAHRIINSRITFFSNSLIKLGYAIPGTVIAVGTLIPLARLDNQVDAWFRHNFDFSTGLLISGTLAALIIAYLVRFLAVALNTIDSGLSNIPNNMDQAARMRPFNFNTLAVRAYELASDERLADASLPSIAIVLVGLVPVILITKKINKTTN